jgi:adenine-specific DNA-methyltransferase
MIAVVELLWEGKYDSGGHRKGPLRVALPFQTVETVNESAQQRQHALDLFAASRDSEWRNRLIWGDKKYVLPALLEEFAGTVKTIYIDPPFFTGDDFSFKVRIGNDNAFVKQPSMIEQKAYRDTWGKGLEGYIDWFYETLVHLRDLLSDDGSIFVHLDWHVGHYAKVVLDDVFGAGALNGKEEPGFRNEIVWCYSGGGIPQTEFPRKHDVIFWYTKGSTWKFNTQYRPYSAGTVQRGRTAVKGENAKLRDEGTPINDWWPDVKRITSPTDPEKVYFDTQKSEELLTRILAVSSDPEDLVLDCFVGSGTTAVAAERMKRRWIAADLGRFAIHTTRKRLLDIEGLTPFAVQNLGKYERQLWQKTEFGDDETQRTAAYRKVILDLYHATSVDGYVWIHGVRAGAMVHVGSVDAPVTMSDVTNILVEVSKTRGPGEKTTKSPAIDILGWDFAFEVHEVASQKARDANIAIRFVRIPREVLDKRAVEQGDVKFFELAALAVDASVKKQVVTLKLTDFVIPVDDVPDDVQRQIKRWSEWIDYWAIDWDNRGDAFHNEWQTFRSGKNKRLEVQTSNEYATPGTYRVVVKVIDILGNDTTKTLDIEVV